MPKVEFRTDRCKGCERCTQSCPQKVLGMSKKLNVKGYFYAEVADPHRCIGCTLCAISCPDAAIEVFASGTRYEFFRY